MAEVEIASGQIEMEVLAGQVVSSAAGDLRAVLEGLNVVELGLAVDEAEISIKAGEWLAVERGLGELEMAFAMRIKAGAGDAQGQVHAASDRIFVTGQGLNFSHVAVANVERGSKWAVIEKLAILEGGA